MFYDVFCQLCEKKGVSPSRAAMDIGKSKSIVPKWREGATPSGDTLALLAEYFNVSTDYLLTGEASANAGATSIEEILSVFSDNESLMLDGKLASPEAAEYLRNSLEAVYEQAKKINEQRQKSE